MKLKMIWNEIKENLNSAKRYWGETTGYTSEVEHQKLRLEFNRIV